MAELQRDQWVLKGAGRRVAGPQRKLWLGYTTFITSPYCAGCGHHYEPTSPLCLFIETMRHGYCRGCAATNAPVLAAIAAMANDDSPTLLKKINECTHQNFGALPVAEYVVEESAEIQVVEGPAYIIEASIVEEATEKESEKS
jgi:hypothetical protein